MLTNIAIFTPFLTFTLAGPESIKNALAAIYQNQTNNPRALSGTSADVGGYGCWCYIDSAHGKGKGHPVDNLDAECKTLHHNYECLIMDRDIGESTCEVDPWDVYYERDVNVFMAMFNLDEDALESACEVANQGDQCKIDVCKVEMSFSLRVSSATLTEMSF